ncbi:PREDICTED: putative serine protease K12H4.7 [Dufourea novaeangliae]|uniref:Putative serine protease K12H4.7 n=1 Tax=Dufourea novaeangliae TaxID=178035 RepID=A0A154P900_DUFNO|nr:PREDICTED: putative serine protease K12H4.7 [Dufourea novaeangliae]KZC08379.1 Putative serine protease K12H4.7 [Dufourea novaeangliae]
MILLSILVTLCVSCRLGNGVGLRGFHFKGLDEPVSSNGIFSQSISERWIEQPLDHFNPRDNRTWSMRYYENPELFKEGGPILIMIGGEWEISTGFLQAGLMYEIARTHGAMMYYTEHRYYGKSRPTADVSSRNLQYLSVDQALADLAYFIETKKKEDKLNNSRVIVFGGSYAGNMATWSRLKYPHLIQGALASSAPVFAKADFHEYYEVVTDSLGKHSQQCVDDIKAAFDAVEQLLAAENGPRKLKSYFNLCEVPKADSPSDLGLFMNALAEMFAGIVQYDSVVNGRTKIADCCIKMTAPYLGSPLQRLARLVYNEENCLPIDYQEFVGFYANKTWNEEDIMRQWTYQTCTEYGYFQTTNSTKSIFGTLFPLSFFTDLCTDLYGDYYNDVFLDTRVKRTNIMYGGLRPDLRNVIFTNGDVDPWHALSVLEHLNDFSPAILIKGSSHCSDLYNDEKTDVPELINARAKVREIISGWIAS